MLDHLNRPNNKATDPRKTAQAADAHISSANALAHPSLLVATLSEIISTHTEMSAVVTTELPQAVIIATDPSHLD